MEAAEIIALVALSTTVIIAAIGGLFKVFDTRNTEQHAENQAVLKEIRTDVRAVEGKLDSHIQWHLGEPPKSDRAA